MRILKILTASLALAGLCAVQAQAQAGLFAGLGKSKPTTAVTKTQFKLPFGMSARKVRRMLSEDGYDEIDVTYLGILDAKAEACRRGKRYSVKVRLDGSYQYRNEIGKCRARINVDAINDLLRKDGFRKIDIASDSSAPYNATACRRGDRYEIVVNEYGDVKVKGRIGRCNPDADMLSPRDVRRALRKDGFNRIRFTDRTPPRYVIEACNRRNRKVRLTIDRRGQISDRRRIGRCAAPIKPDSIIGTLEGSGFNRIEVVDDKPPRYRAEACDGRNQRVSISISPWGKRLTEKRIGECAPRATVASLREQLLKNPKFRAIKIREDRRYPFIAEVCNNRDRVELHFSRWGEYLSKKEIGRCESPRLEKLYSRYDQDGLKNLQTFIEGCTRRGRRVRLTIDQFGTEINRERVGRCNR